MWLVELPRRVMTITLASAAALCAALAVTYLVVACQSLPAALGPVPGDSHPRSTLGAALLVVAMLLAAAGFILDRRLRRAR